MRKLLVFIGFIFIFSCNNDSDKLIVNGNIKGLKKGTVYLKKANDSKIITVDSVIVNGNSEFTLESDIKHPELFYLYFNKNNDKENDNRIAFFGNKGVTKITTTIDRFVYDADISGSPEQIIYSNYLKMKSKFSDKYLEVVKKNFEATKSGDSVLIVETEKSFSSLEKRKLLYTTNFALNHKDNEVAPFLALTELNNANLKLLDTINNALKPDVKSSTYGKQLQSLIDKIKKESK